MYKAVVLRHSATFLHRLDMDPIPKDVALMILVFWIFAPTVDQCLDIAIVTKLLNGPDDDLYVSGGT